MSDVSSSEDETDEMEEKMQFKPRQKRQRKLSERKLLSLEQEKSSSASSRRRTIAGGEESSTRGNKRGHRPKQKQKREWKLSETDNKSKDKLILKFKHRKKD